MPASARALRQPSALVFGGLTLVRPLARAGVSVRLVTTEPAVPLLVSRRLAGALVVAPLDGPTEPHALAALCRAGRDLAERSGRHAPLLVAAGAALAFAARHRARLMERFAVLVPPVEVVLGAADAHRLGRLAASRGVALSCSLGATSRAVDGLTYHGLMDAHGGVVEGLVTARPGAPARERSGESRPPVDAESVAVLASLVGRLGVVGPFAADLVREGRSDRWTLERLDLGFASDPRPAGPRGVHLAVTTFRHLVEGSADEPRRREFPHGSVSRGNAWFPMSLAGPGAGDPSSGRRSAPSSLARDDALPALARLGRALWSTLREPRPTSP